jgi:hypothetical protein
MVVMTSYAETNRGKSKLRKVMVGRAMAQAVSSFSLKTEVRVHARVSPCGICGGQGGIGTGFFPSSSASLVNIFPPWLFMLVSYSLSPGDEQ